MQITNREERSALSEAAKYYFDGRGKALRPQLTSAMASAVNRHLGLDTHDEVRIEDVLTFH